MHQFNAFNGGMCNRGNKGVAVEAFMNAIKQFIASQYKRRILEQRSLNALQFLNGVELVGVVEVGLVHTRQVHTVVPSTKHTAVQSCYTVYWTCTSAIVLGSKFIACRRLTHTHSANMHGAAFRFKNINDWLFAHAGNDCIHT